MSPLVLAICTAYEAGFGHGSEGRATANPYRLADLDSFEAWEYGHQQGTKRRASEPKAERVCADSEDGNHVLKQDGPFSVVYCDACGMNKGFRSDG